MCIMGEGGFAVSLNRTVSYLFSTEYLTSNIRSILGPQRECVSQTKQHIQYSTLLYGGLYNKTYMYVSGKSEKQFVQFSKLLKSCGQFLYLGQVHNTTPSRQIPNLLLCYKYLYMYIRTYMYCAILYILRYGIGIGIYIHILYIIYDSNSC